LLMRQFLLESAEAKLPETFHIDNYLININILIVGRG
jgi:hypothetical protein